MKFTTKLWLGIGILILLSPLGFIVPEYFKSGSAWGEWSAEEMKKLAGYVPQGLEKLSSLWNAPLPDYAFRGWADKGLARLSFAYVISAAAGILVIAGAALLIGKFLAKKGNGVQKQ